MSGDTRTQVRTVSDVRWENQDGPGGATNTSRGLTRSSDLSREGLAMQPTHSQCSPDTCGAIETFKYEVAQGGCWMWRGYVAENGYARIYDPRMKQVVWAHRYSFAIHTGPILPRHDIDHMCQVTQCVNPAHLDMVTRSEHIRRTWARLGKDDLHAIAAVYRRDGLTYGEIADLLGYGSRTAAHHAVQSAIRKGLIGAEEVPPASRLTAAEREDIRALYTVGVPQTVIGEFYHVDSSQISRICSGRDRRRLRRGAA